MPSPSARPSTDRRRLGVALLAIAALALALRLWALGYRVMYYDEAWFGYWTLKFLDHGAWAYRPTMHGPFFVRLNAIVFPLLGASEFTGRLVVAAMGGLLPLSAWLFRERLRPSAVVALAVILALNPILLYYSRFMRKDVPLAACMLVALGLVVRLLDTRRPRYLYAAALSFGVAAGTKESYLLWVLTWLGAGAIVLDYRLVGAHERGSSPAVVVAEALGRARRRFSAWWPHAVLSAALFLAVVVYFYAPRAGDTGGVGLWRALGGRFGMLPAVVGEATAGSLDAAIDHWATGGMQGHPYLPYLTDTLDTLAAGALGVLALAALGFLYDRYAGAGPRALVSFNVYAGLAAIVGYPLANFLPVPWSTTHAVVPLAIPAAVGAGVVYRWGRGSLDAAGGSFSTGGAGAGVLGSRRRWERTRAGTGAGTGTGRAWRALRAVLAAALLLSLVASAAGTASQTSYVAPHESPVADPGNEIVYYAQPPAELRSGIVDIQRAAAAEDGGADVLYVGESMAMDESLVEYPPETGAWHRRIPLPWYTEAAGAAVESVGEPGEIGPSPPPVVITTTDLRPAVADRLGDGYAATQYDLDDGGDRRAVFFVREGLRGG